MLRADWHTYQVLTKRAERRCSLLNTKLKVAARASHIWWGVSVEDRNYGVPRIAHIQRAPAAVRFLSVEPLLEDLGPIELRGIHWVIVGGESGGGARRMEPQWVRNIHAQCTREKIPHSFLNNGAACKRGSLAACSMGGRTTKCRVGTAGRYLRERSVRSFCKRLRHLSGMSCLCKFRQLNIRCSRVTAHDEAPTVLSRQRTNLRKTLFSRAVSGDGRISHRIHTT